MEFKESQPAQEPIKEEVKIKEKSEFQLRLAQEIKDEMMRYVRNYLKPDPRYYRNYFVGFDLESELDILTQRYKPSPEYNKILRGALFTVLNIKGQIEEGAPPLRQDWEGSRKFLRRAFDEFFSPLTERKRLEKELEKNKVEKELLSKELIKINEANLFKEERKKKKGPIETRLVELSRLRKPLEEKLKFPDVLLEFIPGYRTDLIKIEGQLNNFISQMRKNEKQPEEVERFVVPPALKDLRDFADMKKLVTIYRDVLKYGGDARDVFDREQLAEEFRERWLEEKLDKNLKELYKKLENI